jgi:predicted solute-binding protein
MDGQSLNSWQGRVGSVPYLNARPLIYGLGDRVSLCVPSKLADGMARGEYDAGLVPIAEVLRHDRYDLVDGIAIASKGAVYSVFLTHRVPVSSITRVAVDTASRTSAWLVRVILKFGYGAEPEFYPLSGSAKLGDHEAMMLIGDVAIEYRLRDGEYPVMDLGEEWLRLTGLPFVYAAWALQRDTGASRQGLVAELHRAKREGLARLEEVVQSSEEATPVFRREYLTRYVQFDLGGAEKAALRKFQEYLKKMGLVERCHDLRYVG